MNEVTYTVKVKVSLTAMSEDEVKSIAKSLVDGAEAKIMENANVEEISVEKLDASFTQSVSCLEVPAY